MLSNSRKVSLFLTILFTCALAAVSVVWAANDPDGFWNLPSSPSAIPAGEVVPGPTSWPEPVRLDPVTGEPADPAQGDVVVPRIRQFVGPEAPWTKDGR